MNFMVWSVVVTCLGLMTVIGASMGAQDGGWRGAATGALTAGGGMAALLIVLYVASAIAQGFLDRKEGRRQAGLADRWAHLDLAEVDLAVRRRVDGNVYLDLCARSSDNGLVVAHRIDEWDLGQHPAAAAQLLCSLRAAAVKVVGYDTTDGWKPRAWRTSDLA